MIKLIIKIALIIDDATNRTMDFDWLTHKIIERQIKIIKYYYNYMHIIKI